LVKAHREIYNVIPFRKEEESFNNRGMQSFGCSCMQDWRHETRSDCEIALHCWGVYVSVKCQFIVILIRLRVWIIYKRRYCYFMHEYNLGTDLKVYTRCTPSSLAYTYLRKVYTYARFFALKVYTKVYTFLRDLRSTFRVNYTYSLGPLRKVYTCGVHFPHGT
jgi:hypothetical protein